MVDNVLAHLDAISDSYQATYMQDQIGEKHAQIECKVISVVLSWKSSLPQTRMETHNKVWMATMKNDSKKKLAWSEAIRLNFVLYFFLNP